MRLSAHKVNVLKVRMIPGEIITELSKPNHFGNFITFV